MFQGILPSPSLVPAWALSEFRTPPFVGRQDELRQLLADADAPRAARCLITGPLGIGKTRLMVEVAEHTAGNTLFFYEGNAQLGGESDPALLNIPDTTRLLIFDDIDHVRLADWSSFQKILATRPRMSVFMTAEFEDQCDPTWGAVLRSGSEPTRIRLGPLSRRESEELAREVWGDDNDIEAGVERAGGNPFSLQFLANYDGKPLPGANDSLATILGPDGRPLKPEDADFKTVLLTARGISDALIDELAKRPELMHELSWRKFEELVAELYKREGFEVELTRASQDSGVDIYVFQRAPFGSFLTVVDCKRYRADRPVEVGLIEKLYGTVMAKDASVGVIATTSYFSKGAKAFQEDRKHRLGLQDFFSIHDMLKQARGDAR